MRRGFTLVEMLVVIIIIGILAAILVPTIGAAIRRARNTKIGLEINQLGSAVEAYKKTYSDYPPDFSSKPVVDRHIRKAFPKISPQEFLIAEGLFWPNRVDPAEALVFWLGGFSADPRRPFTGPGGPFKQTATGYAININRNAPLFPFNDERLTIYLADPTTGNPSATGVPRSSDEQEIHGESPTSNDLFPVYFPDKVGAPYVYFDSRTYNRAGNRYPPAFPGTSIVGVVGPYLSDLATQPFMNKSTFQIVSSGLDSEFGVAGGSFPSGNGNGQADKDNLTNFSEGSTLGDKVP
jgi:prepilin-type N-terminal cleavage/methylation domain-containing protein